MIRIDAQGEYYSQLNEKIRECNDKEITVDNVLGQRYIGCGLTGRRIIINGTPGNAMGAYLDGSEIYVRGNAQDAVGDTMDDGLIVIDGCAGDAIGYAMRGGEIFVRGSVGYRAGIHMKEYKQKHPVLVVGGAAGSFLGEYQAGGTIIILGLGSSGQIVGPFCGTGMHGGEIFLRSDKPPAFLSEQVCVRDALPEELKRVEKYINRFCEYFNYQAEELLNHRYIILSPNTSSPYRQLYTPN